MVKTLADSRTPPRQGRSRATEARLAAAVLALLDEGGLAACTAPAIAKRAGVAVGTIYARHPDKDALIASALLELVSLDGGAGDSAFSGWAEEADDLAGFIARVARTAMQTARDHRRFLLAVRDFSRRYPDPVWRAAFRGQQGRVRELILQGAVRRFGGAVRGGEAALRMAHAAIHGAVDVTWLEPSSGPFEAPPDPDAFVAALVEMQVRYLT